MLYGTYSHWNSSSIELSRENILIIFLANELCSSVEPPFFALRTLTDVSICGLIEMTSHLNTF